MKNHKPLGEHGFTLIEMIGVLAIIAILAGMLAPNVIKMMQSATQDAEEKALDVLADGLVNYVLDSRIIPQSGEGAGTWATNIGTQTELPAAKIYATDLTCSRRYWFDPATDLNGLTDNTASYDQNTVTAANLSSYSTSSTTSAPTNPRAMIISDLTPSCSNNILVASVAHNTANFAAVWDQTGTLTESSTLKVKRINFAKHFETITLVSGNGSLFSRTTYSNPAAGTLTPTTILTVEENSHIFSVTYSSGGFEPTNIAGGTATVDIGTTSGGTELVSAASVISGVTVQPASVTITSASDITIYEELTIGGASVVNANSGYIDVTLAYVGEPQYKLQGQAGNPTTITITSAGTPEIISFNVLNGTELYLYDQTLTAGVGNLLLTTVIKESESFIYSPGPPPVWGR